MSINISLRSILDTNKINLERYINPEDGREWSQVNIVVTAVPHDVDGKQLGSTTIQSEWVIWHGNEAAGNTAEGSNAPEDVELKKVASKTYYIALKEETTRELEDQNGNILDYRSFGTHGYIPVWSTQEDARQALDQHCQRRVIGRKEFKIYIHENSKLHYRPDHYDKWKHKLFFPIPLGPHNREDLMQRYMQLYKKGSSARYDWDANFAKIEVEEL